jgi:predicted TIM-barrel fold metal-dependent hydrolase
MTGETMDRAAVISVDGHVKPPRAEYREYIDPKWRVAFDEWLESVADTPDGFARAELRDGQWDSKRRIADLEGQGVVAEVLFGNGESFAAGRLDFAPDAEQVRQAHLAFNRWLVDFCSEAPGRLYGQALVSFEDVDQAVADIHWAKEQGLVGILMPPLYPGSKFFFDPALDPIWSACQEVELPLSQHGGTGAPNYQPAGIAAFSVLAAEHSFFSGRSLWQLILGGVFERFPDLKISFIETESWWIAPMMELLDRRARFADDWSEFMQSLGQSKPYSRLPSEYWATNCYAGISPFHPSQVSDGELGSAEKGEAGFAIHSENAMFGVDYPHPETIFPNVIDNARLLAGMPHVSEEDARKVLYKNAAEVFHLDLESLRPEFDRLGFDLAPAGMPS